MSNQSLSFSKKTIPICNNLIVDENKYPFLKKLRSFIEKIPKLQVCYLSGILITSDNVADNPIVKIYIISEKVSPYIYKFIKNKATTIISDFFFPHFILTEVFFLTLNNLDDYSKFCLKCDSAFWFGNKDIHNRLPAFCIKDMDHCCNNYKMCANWLRNHLKKSENGKTLWINMHILLKNIISAIYEKNKDKMDTYHNAGKYDAIVNNSSIDVVDKNIALEAQQLIKKTNQNVGENISINKDFLNFVCNYLDFCNGNKTFNQLLQEDYSVYRNWLQFIPSDSDTNKDSENREDFAFLFKQSNHQYFNRITRDQVLMNKLVPPRPSTVNPAGLTQDVMMRLRKNNSLT